MTATAFARSTRRVVLGAAWLLTSTASSQSPPSEQEVKAAYLYHFTRFVEWPSQSAPEDAFEVAVLGADQFGQVVERTLVGKTIGDRPLSVRRISRADEAPHAAILFIGSEDGQLPGILQALAGRSVLTVGDASGFAERGGIIGFTVAAQRVRFDINVEQANRSGLRISSEMLKLARVVKTRE